MAKLVPQFEDVNGKMLFKGQFGCVEGETVVATGHFEVDLMPGASRHGGVAFVVDEGNSPNVVDAGPLLRGL